MTSRQVGNGWLSPRHGLNPYRTPGAARECGRKPDNPVTARSVDNHLVASVRGVQQPRPVPGQRRRSAGRRPARGPVHRHRSTPRAHQEDRRPIAGVVCQDVGNHAAAWAGRQSPEASHLTPWFRDVVGPCDRWVARRPPSRSGVRATVRVLRWRLSRPVQNRPQPIIWGQEDQTLRSRRWRRCVHVCDGTCKAAPTSGSRCMSDVVGYLPRRLCCR